MKINFLQNCAIKISVIIFLGIIYACSSTPNTKELKTDEDYFNRAMKFFNERNYFEAVPAFQEFKEKFPLSPYAILAELRLGDSHFFKEEYVEAIHMYENFRRLHPNNKSVPYSIYMTGLSYYSQILTIDRDTTYARAAAEQFQQLIEIYPSSPYAGMALFKLSEARRVLAEHEFFIGQFYMNNKNYAGAINRFNTVLQKYPMSIKKDRVIFYLAKANYLSENKEKGEKFLQFLIRKYPDSSYAAQSKALLAHPHPEQALMVTQEQENPEAQEKEQQNENRKKRFFLF